MFDVLGVELTPEKLGGLVIAAVATVMLLRSFFTGNNVQNMDEEEWRPFILIDKEEITSNVANPVSRFRFALPDGESLQLPVGHHVQLRTYHFVDGKKKMAIRSYTPTSTNDDLGYFDLIVKVYPNGVMSQALNNLAIGESIEMRKPKGKWTYEKNMVKRLGMIAGGTGITPMLQVIKEVLKHEDDKTEVKLIFANISYGDIILKDALDELALKNPQFSVHYVLNQPPDNWDGSVGFVTSDIIREHIGSAGDDTRVIMCGPPPMINAMSKCLNDLEFSEDNVFSF